MNPPRSLPFALLTSLVLLLTSCGEQAGVGDTLRLETEQGGPSEGVVAIPLQVELLEMRHPAESESSAGPGMRLAVVEVSITNVGEATYEGPRPQAHLLPGRQAPNAHGPGCDRIGALKLAPGDTRRGCLVFTLEQGDHPHLLRMASSHDQAEWHLRGRALAGRSPKARCSS